MMRPPLSFVPAPTIAVEIGTPNHTLYIQNLNERASLKGGQFSDQDLRYMLTNMFSKYGRVLDIVLKRRMALRGQAWVVFEKKEIAMKALHGLQGKFLYEKPMVIRYARNKSDIVAKLDGTFDQEREKRLQEAIESGKHPRLTRKEQLIQQMLTNPLGMAILPGSNEFIVPNHILFIQNLPPSATADLLTALFKQYPGFQEVRSVPGKPDIAFIEFENEYQSNMAMVSLNNYKIEENEIKITFAKK